MPVYKVTIGDKVRMIKAKTSAGARNHALKDLATVEQIETEDAIELAGKGIKLETAGEEAAPASTGSNSEG